MKIFYITPIVILLISCTSKKSGSDSMADTASGREIVVSELQTIIDSVSVNGAILIYDQEGATYYSNDFRWAKKGNLPASTFKIANSIIALETGTVKNDSTIFKWNGEKRRSKTWEQDLTFRDAFHFSCVSCYQQIARRIGVKNMTEYLDKLGYGNMIVDSANIDLFWLEGESRISQYQQIDFLRRFYQSELPISQRTETIMKDLMVIEANDNYKLSGKTGWSIRNGDNNGWFVGYVETQNKTYFFATNVEPDQQFDMDMFSMIRKDVTLKAFEQMEFL